jgi:hypothetical protein
MSLNYKGELEDWSDEWKQADPRITTLKSKLDDMSTLINSNTSIHTQQLDKVKEDLEGEIKKYSMEVKMLQLLALEKIKPEEFRNLMKMINSPDAENLHVAYETVINLIKDL